jgi:hypothetical protein
MTARFFHVRLPSKPSKGGATVRVSSCQPDHEGNPQVKVQLAMCSIKDSFWRAMGRLNTKAASPHPIKLEFLPIYLHGVQQEVFSRARVAKTKREFTDFSYATKYFEAP